MSSSGRDNASSNNRTESWMNSDNKSSSVSCKQSASAGKYSESEKECKSSNAQNDSEHTIGPPNLNINSKFSIKSEQNSTTSGLIQKEKEKHCFLYKNDEKQVEQLHNPKDKSKEKTEWKFEGYFDQYLRNFNEKLWRK